MLHAPGFQYLGSVVFGVYLFYYLLNDALLADEEGNAVGAHVSFAHELLFAPYAVHVHYFFVSIGYQREGEGEFLFKFFVAGFVIGADTEHYYTLVLQAGVVIAEVAGLGGAAGGIIFRVEVDDYFFALEILQGYGVAILVFGFKKRSGITWFQHGIMV